ncbi:MAG: DsbA family oxidoreductase [Planctomycetota bacterium]
MSDSTTPFVVDVWSDFACPWCYIGKRRLGAALAAFAHANEVQVVWRAFELDPSAPALQARLPYAERLAVKYGMSVADARVRIDQVTAAAAEVGIAMDFDRVQPGNTFDAHRLLQFAREHGRADEVGERLLTAYFCDGRALSDRIMLVAVARAAGLVGDAARAALEGDYGAAAVRSEQKLARDLGIQGVPFFRIDARYGVSGAQPVDRLLEVLQRAYRERAAGG